MANIAFILNRFPDGGGIERVTTNLVGPLVRDKGHNIFIFVHELNQETAMVKNFPVEFINIPLKAWKTGNRDTVYNAIVDKKIDILFLPGLAPEYIFEFKRSKICKICFVLHSLPLFESIAMKNNIPRLSDRWERRTMRFLFRIGYYNRQYVKNYKKIYKNVDAYGVLFDSYKEELEHALNLSPKRSKIFTLPNPISEIKEIPAIGNREKRILFVGRLTHADKRVDRLLDVWEKIHEKFPDWRLEIVGEGGEEHFLKYNVTARKIPRVHFMGYSSTPQTYYSNSEILCLTSDFEGCPMVLLEAQQHGCATIAFDCCSGIRQILSPNWENGVYIKNNDIDAYAEALSKLIIDDKLRRKIQLNGLENVKRFSVENSVEHYNDLINKLCAE